MGSLNGDLDDYGVVDKFFASYGNGIYTSFYQIDAIDMGKNESV